MKYPTQEGLPINPYELDLRPTDLDLSIRRNLNNHHMIFAGSVLGRTALGSTVRNLDRFQVVMPTDTHAYLHGMYSAPYASERDITDEVLFSFMNVVDEAFHRGELIRYGSALTARFSPITRLIYDRCIEDYGRLR
jgi:hypothetical protein